MKIALLITGIIISFSQNLCAQKIFMTGDSHVAGKFYPEKVKEVIKSKKPNIEFSHWGKIGAGFYTFNESEEMMERIFESNPDILIVHLGTNDSYTKKFNHQKFIADMTTFQGNIHGEMPDCKIVYVTPFYNKIREKTGNKSTKGKKGKRRKTVKYGAWEINEKTRECSDLITEFVSRFPNTFVVDNNADAGKLFIEDPSLIRNDYVHLTTEGYNVLGQQVGDKLLEIEDLWPQN